MVIPLLMQTLCQSTTLQNRPSWGVHLWDQTSNLLKYQQSGIVLHERLQKFLLEVSKLQAESFGIQKKLCDKYIVDVSRVVGIETTYGQAFNLIVQSIAKLIDTENLMAVAFELQANGDTKTSIAEERKRLKLWKQDRDRFQVEAKNQTSLIDEELRRYRTKYKEVVKYRDEYERIDADQTYSKLDVEKALNLYSLKHCEFKQARADYAATLDQFNSYRRRHYEERLKSWGDDGHTLEDYRINKTQNLISVLVERLRVTIDRMTYVCSDFEKILDVIDASKDAEVLIQRLSTGKSPPGDIPFENLAISDPPVVGIDSSTRTCYEAYKSTPDNEVQAVVDRLRIKSSGDVVSPNERHLVASSTAPLVGAARRLTSSSLRFGSANNVNGHSLIRRIFSRRSKSKDSTVSSRSQSKCLTRSLSHTESSMTHCLKLNVGTVVDGQDFEVSEFSDTSFGSSEHILEKIPSDSTPAVSSLVQVQTHPEMSTLNFDQKFKNQSMVSGTAVHSQILSFVPSTDQNALLPVLESQKVGSLKRRPRPNRVSDPAGCVSPSLRRHQESPSGCTTNSIRVAQKCQFSSKESLATPEQTIITFPQSRNRGMGGYAGPALKTNRGSSSRSLQKELLSLDIGESDPNAESRCRRNLHQPKRQRNAMSNNRLSVNATTLSDNLDCSETKHFVIIGTAIALYDFQNDNFGSTFISFQAGDKFNILSPKTHIHDCPETDGWLYVEKVGSDGHYGYIPASYVTKQLSLKHQQHLERSPFGSGRNMLSPNHSNQSQGVRLFPRNRENDFLTLGQATEL